MLLYIRTLQNRGQLYKGFLSKKAINRQKIVVDFSSPNIAKQFHVGNLRSTLIGNFYCKINRLAGHEVVALNYLGDWGTQFSLLAAHWPTSKLKNKFNELPVGVTLSQRLLVLQQAYVEAAARAKIDEDFALNKAAVLLKQMEDALINNNRDDQVLSLWLAIRKVSIEYLHSFYGRLNIQFDVFDAESDHVAHAKRLIDQMIDKKVAALTTDNIWTVRDEVTGGYCVIRKPDGTTNYLTREVAATITREKNYGADLYSYVVDRAQSRHFVHLQHLLEVNGQKELAQKINHVGFGRVIGMSTRKGKVETVEQILVDGDKEATKFINRSKTIRVSEEEVPEVARELAESALFINDLKRNKHQEYTFNFKEIFRANSPFAVHEKYTRLSSLIEKNEDVVAALSKIMESEYDSSNLKLDDEPNMRLLCQCLYELDAAIFSSYQTKETAPIFSYLTRLASRVGSAMATARVKDEPNKDLAIARMMVFVAARNVLEEGLQLLGLKPLPRL